MNILYLLKHATAGLSSLCSNYSFGRSWLPLSLARSQLGMSGVAFLVDVLQAEHPTALRNTGLEPGKQHQLAVPTLHLAGRPNRGLAGTYPEVPVLR